MQRIPSHSQRQNWLTLALGLVFLIGLTYVLLRYYNLISFGDALNFNDFYPFPWLLITTIWFGSLIIVIATALVVISTASKGIPILFLDKAGLGAELTGQIKWPNAPQADWQITIVREKLIKAKNRQRWVPCYAYTTTVNPDAGIWDILLPLPIDEQGDRPDSRWRLQLQGLRSGVNLFHEFAFSVHDGDPATDKITSDLIATTIAKQSDWHNLRAILCDQRISIEYSKDSQELNIHWARMGQPWALAINSIFTYPCVAGAIVGLQFWSDLPLWGQCAMFVLSVIALLALRSLYRLIFRWSHLNLNQDGLTVVLGDLLRRQHHHFSREEVQNLRSFSNSGIGGKAMCVLVHQPSEKTKPHTRVSSFIWGKEPSDKLVSYIQSISFEEPNSR